MAVQKAALLEPMMAVSMVGMTAAHWAAWKVAPTAALKV